MTLATRTLLTLALTLTALNLAAQELSTSEPAPPPAAAQTATVAAPEPTDTDEPAAAGTGRLSSFEIRSEFTRILQRHPQDLTTILTLDPSLLANPAFMSAYPEVAEFVAANPQILRNPRFYLRDYPPTPRDEHVIDDIVEMMLVFGGFVLGAFVLSWLVRTVIEQRRWNRLSRTQAEVHNKILDRFSTSEELLAYVKTPAGTKFLESAPIPLHAERPTQSTPFTRIVWSVQLGVVVAAGALGMILMSLRFGGESGEALFAMGVVAISIGVGFIASAAVSLFLSHRLGAGPSGGGTPDGAERPGLVR